MGLSPKPPYDITAIPISSGTGNPARAPNLCRSAWTNDTDRIVCATDVIGLDRIPCRCLSCITLRLWISPSGRHVSAGQATRGVMSPAGRLLLSGRCILVTSFRNRWYSITNHQL